MSFELDIQYSDEYPDGKVLSIINENESHSDLETSQWTPEQHRQQWKEGVQRILDGAERSLLIFHKGFPYDPRKTYRHYYYYTMDMYRHLHGVDCRFHNYFHDTIDVPDPYNPEVWMYDHIYDPSSRPDVWSEIVSINDLREWLEKQN